MQRIPQWVYIICLPLMVLSISIAAAINTPLLYEYGFAKYDIATITGLPETELNNAANGLIEYFNNSDEYIHVTVYKYGQPMVLFNEQEVLHLKDVKALFWLDYRISILTSAYVVLYIVLTLFLRRKTARWDLNNGAVWGGSITLGLMAVLGLTAIFNFNSFFLNFHIISFSNSLWQLDPLHDYLLMMFPGGFWQDATIFIALMTACMATVAIGLGLMMCRKSRPPE